MPISDDLRGMLEQISGQVPVWLDAAVAMAGIWGVFLWLFGGRIIKPSLAMSGLIAGALIGALVGRDLGGPEKVAIAVIVGGVIGAVIVWATYRVWVALLLATVLGLVAPWAVLAWHGQGGPELKQSIKEEVKGIAEKGGEALAADSANADESAEGTANHAAAGKELFDRMVEAVKRLTGELRDWWEQSVSASLRWSALAGGLMMAIAGLMLGLLMPELGASVVASISGATLMTAAALRLGGRYVPSMSEWLPDSPRRLLIALAVLAAVGALIQWTILRRKADKSE
ncbi:MAG: hypothetical protein WC058_00715 [Phycisphaeraceae bacterium]